MMIVDMIMRVPDSYWKRQFNAERIKANKAQADLKYSEAVREDQERDLANYASSDIKQRSALDVMAKEIEKLRRELDEKEMQISGKDKEIVLLHEALRSERDLNNTLRTNSRLWENIKGAVKGDG